MKHNIKEIAWSPDPSEPYVYITCECGIMFNAPNVQIAYDGHQKHKKEYILPSREIK